MTEFDALFEKIKTLGKMLETGDDLVMWELDGYHAAIIDLYMTRIISSADNSLVATAMATSPNVSFKGITEEEFKQIKL